jgi:hypothetical protein
LEKTRVLAIRDLVDQRRDVIEELVRGEDLVAANGQHHGETIEPSPRDDVVRRPDPLGDQIAEVGR